MKLPSIPQIISLQTIKDHRGMLSVAEYSKHIGFNVKRIYYLYNTIDTQERGHHTHKKLAQCLIALKGNIEIVLEKDNKTYKFNLSKPDEALILPPGYWRVVNGMSNEDILLVLASEEYDKEDYIYDYQEFLAWEKQKKQITSVPFIDFEREYEDNKFDLLTNCEKVFKSNHYINGPECKLFEKEFAEFCEVPFAIGVANGLEAISLILRAWNIGYGDEVLVAANSFIATAIAVSNVNAKPVLVDCDPQNFNIDPTKLEAAITPNTRAIALTHLYGQAADMDPILSIARKHGLKVLEDSAQAHGAIYKGKRCGNLGDAGAFSFYPTKNLGAYGDGGMITIHDEVLANKIRMMCNYGSKIKYHHEILGTNSRLDELQAALLRVKLVKLESLNKVRRDLAAIYLTQLSEIKDLSLPMVMPEAEHVWHVFPIRVKNQLREKLIKHLEANKIGYNIHYPIPIHLQNAYKDLGYSKGDFPEAEQASEELLSLPLSGYHTKEEINFVVKVIKDFFN